MALQDGIAPTKNALTPETEIKTAKFDGKRCFVIMPYGTKKGQMRDGDRVTDVVIDFDSAFAKVIKPAVDALGLRCEVSRTVDHSGLVHKEMIEAILQCDVVVVDITLNNANVFYELGIRHAARRSGTVVIRRAGQSIPFNINGLRVFDYDDAPDRVETSIKLLATTIANSLAEQAVDSLVYSLTGSSLSIQRIGRPIDWCEKHSFTHDNIPDKRLGIVTGDICHVKGIDVWVNPENTRMQMGRMHDQSLSACVRYLGGQKNVHKRVVRDDVQNELEAKIGRDGLVEAGQVVTTGSGRLASSHGVKAIVHTAAMHGEPTKGYQLIRSFPNCVTNSLIEIDRLNTAVFEGLRLNRYRGKLKTVVLPLLGTRENRTDPQDVAYQLVLAATNYLEDHPESAIEAVYFLAFTDVDKALCEGAFHSNEWSLVT